MRVIVNDGACPKEPSCGRAAALLPQDFCMKKKHRRQTRLAFDFNSVWIFAVSRVGYELCLAFFSITITVGK